MIEAAKFGTCHTPHIKVKLNDDMKANQAILARLDAALPFHPGHYWSIDANCSWTPEFAIAILNTLMIYKHRIAMVE